MATITAYKLAELIMDYNDETITPEKVHRFAKTVVKHSEMYIRIAKERGLI